jgi:hypothetical protein
MICSRWSLSWLAWAVGSWSSRSRGAIRIGAGSAWARLPRAEAPRVKLSCVELSRLELLCGGPAGIELPRCELLGTEPSGVGVRPRITAALPGT